MRTAQVIVAIVLSLVMLYVARANSEGRPEYFEYTENGYTFRFNTVPKEFEHSTATFSIRVDGVNDQESIVLLRYLPEALNIDPSQLEQYQTKIMLPTDTTADVYVATLKTGEKLTKIWYYFQVQNTSGALEAQFAKEEGTPFRLRAIGHVPALILIPHVVLMFATVAAVVMAAIRGFQVVAGGDRLRSMAVWMLWATLLSFIGGYPFGFGMNYYAFGVMWEGVPFGTDATDNKTQLLVVYFVIVTVSAYGSLINKPQKNLFGPKALGAMAVGSFFVMLAIYLIPHSIQFSPTLTRVVCWSAIGIMALVPIIGRLKQRGDSHTT